MILLLTSCGTVKVQREIVEIDFPEFPLIESQFDEQNRIVTISFDDFLELARFKINYEATIEFYERIKEKENGSK